MVVLFWKRQKHNMTFKVQLGYYILEMRVWSWKQTTESCQWKCTYQYSRQQQGPKQQGQQYLRTDTSTVSESALLPAHHQNPHTKEPAYTEVCQPVSSECKPTDYPQPPPRANWIEREEHTQVNYAREGPSLQTEPMISSHLSIDRQADVSDLDTWEVWTTTVHQIHISTENCQPVCAQLGTCT